jgi:hypothetical protein
MDDEIESITNTLDAHTVMLLMLIISSLLSLAGIIKLTTNHQQINVQNEHPLSSAL